MRAGRLSLVRVVVATTLAVASSAVAAAVTSSSGSIGGAAQAPVGAAGVAGQPKRITKHATIDFMSLPDAPKHVARHAVLESDDHEAAPPSYALPKGASTSPVGPTVNGPGARDTRTASPSPVATFDGLDDNGTLIPPDTQGAVGPTYVMTQSNGGVQVLTRAGVVVKTVTLDVFWQAILGTGCDGATNFCSFDPRIEYDPYGGRFIVAAGAFGNSTSDAVLLGASATSDPTGTWHLYGYDWDSSNTTWADYPMLGFNKNWITISYNDFHIGGSFVQGEVFAFTKSDVYGGVTSPRLTGWSDAGAPAGQPYVGFGDKPVRTYDATQDAEWLVQTWNENYDGTHGNIRLSKIVTTDPLCGSASPCLIYSISFPSTTNWTFSGNGGADFGPQKSTTHKIDTGDDRMQSAVFRNGHVYAAQTVFLPAATATRSSLQFWDVTIPSSGTFPFSVGRLDDSTAANFYAYPSIAVNSAGSYLIGYAHFSSTIFAEGDYAYHAAGDAAGTLRTGVVVKAGLATYYKTFGATKNRWGDYSGTEVDPVNDTDFWTVQEYAALPVTTTGCSPNCDRWGLWWARVDLAAPAITGFTPTSGTVGKVVTVNGTGFFGATRVFFSSATGTANLGATPVNGSVADTSLQVKVPNGALTGKITVQTPAGTSALSSSSFKVKPKITSLSPSCGSAGTAVTITGSAFTSAATVTFNGVAATVSGTPTYTSISTSVPGGATSGSVVVNTNGGKSAGKTFTIPC